MPRYSSEMHSAIMEVIFSITREESDETDFPTSCPLKFLEKLSETTTTYECMTSVSGLVVGLGGNMFYGTSEENMDELRQVNEGSWYRVLKVFEGKINQWVMNHNQNENVPVNDILRVKWCDLQKVFSFYAYDARVYSNNIGRPVLPPLLPGWENGMRGINEFLGLDIIEDYSPGWMNDYMVKILKQRYLTGDHLYFWNDEGDIIKIEAGLAGMSIWWETTIYSKIISTLPWINSWPERNIDDWIEEIYNEFTDIYDDTDVSDEDSDDSDDIQRWPVDLAYSEPIPTDPEEQKNNAKEELSKLFSFIEEKKETWNMNDGDYLKISNHMKKTFDSL